ncbi:MAG: hypothetical protein OXI54_10570 [Chloroflexota bacterium]|nr:hypothetical protein [Chloroflexota bacterium]
MSNKKRKYVWSGALAMAIVGVLTAFLVLGSNPGVTDAHGGAQDNTHCEGLSRIQEVQHDLRATNSAVTPTDEQHTCADPSNAPSDTGNGGNGGNGNGNMGSDDDAIDNSSTTGGAGVELILTIASLPMNAVDGSSVELFLEDDFQVPDTIDRGSVYFTVPGGNLNQNNGGRVYAQYAVEIDDDDHYGGDDDWSIRVFIPDMNNAENSGYNGPTMGQTVNLVLTKAAGIKNPTEAGTHSVGYKVLGANDEPNETDGIIQLGTVATVAKISLSDEEDTRGKEVTVTGTGFNNGTGAEVYVLVADTKPASCMDLVANDDKVSLGTASVGSDDKFTVTFTVHQDDFDPGAVNHICAVDSEAGNPRFSSDVDTFELSPKITLDPSSGSYGDEITLEARDFKSGTKLSSITLGPTMSWTNDGNSDNDDFEVEIDGNDYIFDLPGGLDARTQVAAVGIDGEDNSETERAYLTVEASSLTLSQTEVAPNASIIISGSGFAEGVKIYTDMITIDDKALDVSDAGTQADGNRRFVQVTSNGAFTATVRIWTASDSVENPALDDDEYTIKVVDDSGFEGEATITILEPTVSVSPDTASPRDFIVISGENWPISTADDDHEVSISVDGRNRTANIDGNGRFRYEYQLRSTIGIGDEHDVVVTFNAGAGGDIEEETTFNVTEAELGLSPGMAAPGQTISVSIEGMPPYTLVDHVKIDGADRLGGRNVNTDREGDATVSDILVPFLDPGFYPVEVNVGEETRVAQLEVLAEAIVGGVAAELPGAVSDLGDSLEAIFHFNNTSKEWTFFDPRPEFADLNTLNEVNAGQPYWVLVDHSHEDVDWNGRLVDFTCAAGDCWNLEIW